MVWGFLKPLTHRSERAYVVRGDCDKIKPLEHV